MPSVARVGDTHVCPAVCPGPSPSPHVGGPITSGSDDVLVGGKPAARLGDTCACACAVDKIIKGSSTVLINGKPAARTGDGCAHGGKLVGGHPTVLIGG
ncbi:MAG: PAAR domain-containing protein [Myxococcales bacterium]|nr:PAAR domain-containing protein [Myxococcales bacterium]